jgi:hypothetical protein
MAMVKTIEDHYANLLGPVYTWMIGDIDDALARSGAELDAQGGLFAATFRDYVSAPLQGDARFILVRSDHERLLTCFLEYADTTVTGARYAASARGRIVATSREQLFQAAARAAVGG